MLIYAPYIRKVFVLVGSLFYFFLKSSPFVLSHNSTRLYLLSIREVSESLDMIYLRYVAVRFFLSYIAIYTVRILLGIFEP